MSWQIAVGLASLVILTLVAVEILKSLERLNKQIENVRFYLGELNDRQKRMSESLHSVEHHARRTLSDPPGEPSWWNKTFGPEAE